MARRRFQRTGRLFKEGNWWRLQYYEHGDPGMKPRKRNEALGLCRGAEAIPEKEARRRAAEKLREANLAAIAPGSTMLLRNFIERHFQPEHVATLKRGGQTHYRVNLAPLLAAYGDWALRDIRQEHIQKLCLGLLARTYTCGKGDRAHQIPYSVQSALHLKNAASRVFEHAKDLGTYPGENPARRVRLPEMKRKESHTLSADQVQRLLAALPEPSRAIAELAVLTSMNIAEICGLKWGDVNLTPRWLISEGEPIPPRAIAVRRQFREGEYGTLKKPSRAIGSSRRRDLPIDGALAKLLRSLKPGPPDRPVFHSRTGTPVDGHNVFNRQLKPAARRLGMPWLGWHTFRHTHATLLRQAGAAPADQMAMMGHAGLRMTMSYGEQDLDRRRLAVSRIAGKIAARAPRKARARA
jgi:ATP-dependent helicase/nuclease subunit A